MPRRILVLASFLGFALLLYVVARTPVVADGLSEVFVTNFPAVQTVDGEVKIRGPVRLAELVSFNDVLVPPVRPTDTTRLLDAGVLQTAGFPNVVLSLHGQVKGSVARRGEVGAILLPAREPIQQAFNEQGLVHFALDVKAPDVSVETPYFASTQPRYTVGFDAYRVLLYNTTDKTVTVNLYAYLTN
jgi:hypothetical protein